MRNCCYAHHQPSIRKPQKKTRPFSYCCCCYIIRSYISNSSLRTTNNRTEKSTATIWWVRDVHKLGLLVKKKGRRRYILDFRSEKPIGTSPPGTCVCFNIPHLCATFSNTADDFFFSWIGEKLARTGSVFSSLQHLDFVILKLFFFTLLRLSYKRVMIIKVKKLAAAAAAAEPLLSPLTPYGCQPASHYTRTGFFILDAKWVTLGCIAAAFF